MKLPESLLSMLLALNWFSAHLLFQPPHGSDDGWLGTCISPIDETKLRRRVYREEKSYPSLNCCVNTVPNVYA